MKVGDITQAHKIREQLLNRQSGKWLLTQANPNEFDYYMIAFELLKSDLSTSKYFVFPILPNSIEYNDIALTKINKTAGGISVLKTQQFNIKSLNISGNFGKNFKVLLGDTYSNLLSAFSGYDSTNQGLLNNFSAAIKTGYGCTKVLEDILKSSNQKDELGGHQFLIFYNLAFNQKFFVEFEDQSYSQSLETNGIWNYSIRLKATGNVDDYIQFKTDDKSTRQLVINDVLQKSANKAYSKISNILKKNYNSITR